MLYRRPVLCLKIPVYFIDYSQDLLNYPIFAPKSKLVISDEISWLNNDIELFNEDYLYDF